MRAFEQRLLAPVATDRNESAGRTRSR
jgi:hypothetical protein